MNTKLFTKQSKKTSSFFIITISQFYHTKNQSASNTCQVGKSRQQEQKHISNSKESKSIYSPRTQHSESAPETPITQLVFQYDNLLQISLREDVTRMWRHWRKVYLDRRNVSFGNSVERIRGGSGRKEIVICGIFFFCFWGLNRGNASVQKESFDFFVKCILLIFWASLSILRWK